MSARLVVNLIEYTDTQIIEMVMESNLVPEDEFTVGSTVCNRFEATLSTTDKILSLEKIEPFIGLDIIGSIEEVPLGIFNIDVVTVSGGSQKIVAYDNMIKFEKPYFSDLTYPATIQNIVLEVCGKAGVTFSSTLPAYSMPTKIEGKTLREVLGIISGTLGMYAKIDRLGALKIRGLVSTDLTVNPNNYFGNIDKFPNPFIIKKLTAVREDDTTLYVGSGLPSEEVTVYNNYITQAQLDAVLVIYNNYTYLPLKLSMQGNPAVEVGDIVSITDVEGTVYTIPVMRSILSYKGGLKGEISSLSKTDNKLKYSYKGTVGKKIEVLYAEQLNVRNLLVDKASIQELNAINARIDNLDVLYLSVDALDAVNASIITLEAEYADVVVLVADKVSTTQLAATNADIDTLFADRVTTSELNAVAATIIDVTTVELSANQMTTGTLEVDRLIIRGATNSLVYELNNITGALQSQNVDTLNGEVLTQRTITADKIIAGSLTANEIKANSILASNIKVGELVVGTNVIMGANAVITWGNLSPDSQVNLKGDTGDQGIQGIQGIQGDQANLPSYITSTKITATTIESPTITSGSISADAITGGTLKLGGLNNGNGSFVSYDADGEITVTISNEGINLEGTNTLDSKDEQVTYGGEKFGQYIKLGRGAVECKTYMESFGIINEATYSGTGIQFYNYQYVDFPNTGSLIGNASITLGYEQPDDLVIESGSAIILLGYVYIHEDTEIEGSLSTSSTLTCGATIVTDGVSKGLNVGSPATVNDPRIKFSSSGNSHDYDSMILATGGTTGGGNGQLHIYGSKLQVYADLYIYGSKLQVYADIFTTQRVIAVSTTNFYGGSGLRTQGNGSANTIFPSVSFYQAGIHGSTIQCKADGDFSFYKTNGTTLGYVNCSKLDLGASYITSGTSALNIYSPYGVTTIGMENASYCHLRTDAAAFYVAKQVNFAGSIISQVNNTMYNGISSNAWKAVYAYAHVTLSDRELKENIIKLDDESSYDIVRNMNTYQYNFKKDNRIMIGTLADEMPMEIIDNDSEKAIDLYALSTMTLSALKEAMKKIESLELRIEIMEGI